jgi:hypothetical protein
MRIKSASLFGATLLSLTFISGCAGGGVGGLTGATMCAAGYCASEEPEKVLSSNGTCEYENIKQAEFRIANGQGAFVKYAALFDKGRKRLYQTPESSYIPLLTQNFKVIGIDAVTVETENAARTGYNYEDIELGGQLYKLNKSYSTKVLTQNCSVFYLSMSPTDIKLGLELADGSTIPASEYSSFYGSGSLSRLSLNPVVTYDNFEKLYKVETPIFDEMVLRGTVIEATGKEIALQIYTTVSFSGDWANIDRAFSASGDQLTVTRIKSDPDCSGTSLGLPCILNETVGVNLTRQFLERHKSGVEIKLSGQKSTVVYVPGPLIVALVTGLDDAQQKIKNGNH